MSKLFVQCAAIKHSGVIFIMPRPARHHHLIQAMAKLGIPTPINATEINSPEGQGGFMLSNGHFATRRAAKRIAFEAGQITEERFLCKWVFCSEDLY